MSDDEYELVLPFVCVSSKGGPFDDEAFVAGYRCAEIVHRLSYYRFPKHVETVETVMVEQMDLVAMWCGYTMTSAVWEPAPEWSIVTFRLSKTGEQK